jgi:hypothetical protein
VPRCSATTVRGKPCSREAAPGSELCSYHERRSPRGRPTLLTDELADRLSNLLAAGNYDETAARAAGISARTLRDWLHRGLSSRDRDEPYRRLRGRLDEARANGEAAHVARIAKAAADGDWKASAWFLERSYPARWGRPALRPPLDGRDEDDVEAPAPADPEPVAPPPGVFSEVDELARKRASGSRAS